MARANRTPEEQLRFTLARVAEVEARDQARNDLYNELEELRHRKHAITLPDAAVAVGIKPLRTSIINREIKTVVAINSEAFPNIKCPPADNTRKARELSSKKEKFLNALLKQLDAQGGPHRPYLDGWDAQSMFGQGCDCCVYLPDAWESAQFAPRKVKDWRKLNDGEALPEGAPEQPARIEQRADGRYVQTEREETPAEYTARTERYKEQAPIPFHWSSPDPRAIHVYTANGEVVEALEIGLRPRFDLADAYHGDGVRYDGDKKRLINSNYGDLYAADQSGAGGSETEAIKFAKHWELVDDQDEEGRKAKRVQITYVGVTDRVLLAQLKPGYPTIQVHSFFGYSTSSRDPLYEGQSVVEDMRELVPSLDQALTYRQAWAYFAAFAMGHAVDPAADQAAIAAGSAPSPLPPIVYQPWSIQRGGAGSKIEWLQPPPVGRDLAVLPESILALVKDASPVPDILRGKSEADTPAFLGAQNLAAATRNLSPLVENRALAIEKVCKFILWAIERLHGDRVYVETEEKTRSGRKFRKKISLSPEEIAGDYSLTVEITTLSQDRMIQWGQFLMQMEQAGYISKEEMRELGLMLQAPEESERKVLAEKAIASDQFWQRLMQVFEARVAAKVKTPPQMPPGPVGPDGLPLDPMQAAAMQGQAMGPMAGQPGGPQALPGAPNPQAPGLAQVAPQTMGPSGQPFVG